MKIIKKIRKNISLHTKRIAFEGIGFTIILLLICVILISNIVRVVSGGIRNYNIFLEEQETLNVSIQKNEELTVLDQITSQDEYLVLLARDTLKLGLPNQELYEIVEGREFYQIEKELLNLQEKESYSDWWFDLLKI